MLTSKIMLALLNRSDTLPGDVPDSSETSPLSLDVDSLARDRETFMAEILELYRADSAPWVVGYSGGKDSTAVLQLVWYALEKLPVEQRTKPVHVITTDTLVENPIVAKWVRTSLELIRTSAQAQKLPFQTHLLHPDLKDTFWVNLIGRGYPAPRNKFRWCTERLKIHPSNRFIREVVRAHGEVILVLGTRKAESAKRSATMTRLEKGRVRDRLSPNASLPRSWVYSPIEAWSNQAVWTYLMTNHNPWGVSNRSLRTMYKSASADNECPLVVDTSTPSCGSSRFGCWVCTMVDQDKSMEAMIENDIEKEWMQPLLDIRNNLDEKHDWDRRDSRRMNGNVQLFKHKVDGEEVVEPIPGPYLREWRERWLRDVLSAQTQIRKQGPSDVRDITLISPEELSEIRRIWREEKHEFNDSLPQIYRETTGEIFKDPRQIINDSLLGTDEWKVLEEVCANNTTDFELLAKLLGTERQFLTTSRRNKVYDALEKCLETHGRSKDEAISHAHQKWELKKAALEGDVETVKKLI